MTDEERCRLETELEALRRELEERRASVPAHTIRPHQLLVLEALRRELEERRASVPAHSIRPHQLLVLEELEERIADLCVKLGAEG